MAKAKPKAATPPPAETPAQPYYLQKARIKDYRSVRDAEVEFKPGLNIIIGPNGAGKTNFLRAVEAGIGERADSSSTPNSAFEIVGKLGLSISYKTPIQSIGTLEHYFPHHPEDMISATVIAHYEEGEVEASGPSLHKIAAQLTNELGERPYWLVVFIRHGLGATQLQLLQNSADLEVMKWGVGHSGERGGFFSSFISSLTLRLIMPWGNSDGSLIEVRHSTSTVKKAVSLVAERHLAVLNPSLARYSPIQEARLSELVQAYSDPVNDAIQVRGLTLEYRINGVWLPFDALSDGTRRLVYLISELLSPIRELEPDKIILLEEPELGIHPHQLHLLLNLIREVSEKHQVILTTHSPQVLDMLQADELDRILIFELLDPNKGTQFRRLTEEQQEHARRYMKEVGFLSDYWRLEDLDGVIANSAR